MTTVEPGPAVLNLSVEQKRELISRLLRERQPGQIPTSFAQRQLWLAEQINSGTPAYSVFFGMRLVGPLDMPALTAAVSAIVARHAPLRTTFALGDDDVVQLVSAPAPVPLPVTDLSALPADQREARANQAVRVANDMLIDLSEGPLLRASVVRLLQDEPARQALGQAFGKLAKSDAAKEIAQLLLDRIKR